MKRVFLLLTPLILCVAFVGPAMSSSMMDGAALYKRCAGCHGADGSSSAKAGGTVLKGQTAEDLEKKLLGYQDGTYGGAKAMIMKRMVSKLSGDQVKTLAEAIAGF